MSEKKMVVLLPGEKLDLRPGEKIVSVKMHDGGVATTVIVECDSDAPVATGEAR